MHGNRPDWAGLFFDGPSSGQNPRAYCVHCKTCARLSAVSVAKMRLSNSPRNSYTNLARVLTPFLMGKFGLGKVADDG